MKRNTGHRCEGEKEKEARLQSISENEGRRLIPKMTITECNTPAGGTLIPNIKHERARDTMSAQGKVIKN